MISLLHEINVNGFAMLDPFLAEAEVHQLIAATAGANGSAGLRQLHVSISEVGSVLESAGVRSVIEALLGKSARVVRSLLFDKTPDKNWAVPWHQDLTIAVTERHEVKGFVGWSMKEGVHHVQAPAEILEQMLTMRINLDECGLDNGPLRLLSGTHRDGWLDSATINRFKETVPETLCIGGFGSVLLMRPLLLHASSRADKPGHRHVLHVDFAGIDLPGGLSFFAG
jgi:hypothetical protein